VLLRSETGGRCSASKSCYTLRKKRYIPPPGPHLPLGYHTQIFSRNRPGVLLLCCDMCRFCWNLCVLPGRCTVCVQDAPTFYRRTMAPTWGGIAEAMQHLVYLS
jgi:hypothetical protein